jgi:hypothetical protein
VDYIIYVKDWEKVNEYRPDNDSVLEDSPYTRDQIRRLLDIAGIREQCIIL